ncbi:MAG: M1 family aminopeptidase, partial [Rhodanobacteraceae bacterium]
AMTLVSLSLAALGVYLWHASIQGDGRIAGTPNQSAAYETAAWKHAPQEPTLVRSLSLQADMQHGKPVTVHAHYALQRLADAGDTLLLTWALRAEAIQTVEVDGHPVQATSLAPGLFSIPAPRSGRFSIDIAGRLGATPAEPYQLISSLYGQWPLVPLVGAYPELFPSDEKARKSLGLPAFDRRAYQVFLPSGVSRPTIPLTLELTHDCDRTALMPSAAHVVATEDHGACIARYVSDQPKRLEILFGTGHWNSREWSEHGLVVRLLFASEFTAQTREFERSLSLAVAGLHQAFGDLPSHDMTIVFDHMSLLDGSTALSKPGVMLVSDIAILHGSRQGELRRERETGLMAHELTHQWFGHAVRPRTGEPGAVFVNEMPAEVARAAVIRNSFGDAAYRRYLHDRMIDYHDTLLSMSLPQEVAINSTRGITIYARSAMLAHILGGTLGWRHVTTTLASFAHVHAFAAPVSSQQLLAALLENADPRITKLAHLLVESDATFRRDPETGSVSVLCTQGACDSNPLVPLAEPGSHATSWEPLGTLNSQTIRASLIAPLILPE